MPSKVVQRWIIGLVAVGFVLYLGNKKKDPDVIFLFPFGLLVGFVGNAYYLHWKDKNWVRQNAQPDYPSRPSASYAAHKSNLWAKLLALL